MRKLGADCDYVSPVETDEERRRNADIPERRNKKRSELTGKKLQSSVKGATRKNWIFGFRLILVIFEFCGAELAGSPLVINIGLQ